MKDDKDVNGEGKELIVGHAHTPMLSILASSYLHIMVPPTVHMGRARENPRCPIAPWTSSQPTQVL